MIIYQEISLTIFLLLCTQSIANERIRVPSHLQDVNSWSSRFLHFILSGITEQRNSTMLEMCSSSPTFAESVFHRVTTEMHKFSGDMEDTSNALANRQRSRVNPLNEFVQDTLFDDTVGGMLEATGVIKFVYKQFLQELPTLTKQDLCRLASELLYSENGLSAELDKLRDFMEPTTKNSPSTLQLMIRSFKEPAQSACSTGHSSMEYFHSIYSELFSAEVKAFVMQTMVLRFLSSFSDPEKTCAVKSKMGNIALVDLQKKFEDHIAIYNNEFIPRMKNLSREFHSCDEGKLVRYETFLELEGLYQGILHLPLHADVGYLDYSTTLCDVVDTYSNSSKLSKFFCDPTTKFCVIPEHRPCHGRTWQCSSYAWAEACRDRRGPRRYRWVRLNNDERPESFFQCPPNEKISLSFWRLKKPCICQCMDNTLGSFSIHVINLQPVKSDVANNMIITGIKFVVKNGILQFQIQQGQLGRNWQVDNVAWKPINDIGEKVRAARSGIEPKKKKFGVQENIDFLIITIGENHGINFDDLQVPFGYVLTGVRFILANRTSEKPPQRVEIALIASEFDPVSGKLCTTCRTKTIRSSTTHNQKYPLKIDMGPRFPTIPASATNQYVVVTTSTFEDDGAQTTLPLFDALPLETNPPSPVGGLGLFHKAAPPPAVFTGFISLKFFSLDYAKYMETAKLNVSQYEIPYNSPVN
ncbi:uncharacterized protein LOC135169248 [Diachasmimorpha longicaudata]|uniref:uncharacterized protein LOC135169248 n=1 Tax=Diachasmimorpha longicaudata TaxID=58733 RepID=UPI0030B8A540